jgi:hypothetical protein
MTKQRTIRLVPGSLALILAVTAYILGSAPFTPALALLLLALPLALLSAFMGAWRLALLTLYFATAICFIVFFAGFLSIRLDYLLALLGVIGIALGGALFYFYQQTWPVN